MQLKKGFLLVESLFSLVFLIVFVLIVTYAQIVIFQLHHASMQRFRAINLAQNIIEKNIQNKYVIHPADQDGFTFLIKEMPREMELEVFYKYKNIHVTIQWQSLHGKAQSVTLYSGMWYT